MTTAYITLVGKLKDNNSEEEKEVTLCGYADVIMFTPGSPPPRPHPTPPDPNAPRPSHPIALPGDPWWGADLKPTHPIFLPGMPGWPETPPDGGGGELPLKPVIAWTPETGWVVVYVPTGEHVTPSK